jgi:hypothetical protein
MKIKKLKCSPSLIYIFIGALLVLASLDFLGIDHYYRMGIHKANNKSGLFVLMIAFLMFVLSKLFCVLKEKAVYKCIFCGGVHEDNYKNDFKCQNCGNGVIDVEDYYSDDKTIKTIYIPSSTRPIAVKALHQKENVFQIVSDVADEHALYRINDIVKCKMKKFDDGKEGLVAYEQISKA